ncbi:MAG: ABC transporter permease subunit [Acidimicrobiia bacterium]|nr:ABC transporter permease subunit [Acidimicrobiia bacterium]
MLRNVFTKDIWDRRVSMIWWVVGMVLLTLWLAVLYPVLRDSEAMQDFLEEFPVELLAAFGMDPDTFMTGAGYLSAQMFSFIAPIVVISFTIIAGVAATAGEERRGTMDMLLATPVSRRSVALQKGLSLAVLTGVIVASIAVTLLVMNPLIGLDLRVEGLLAICIGLWLLGLVFGYITMALGAFTGNPTLTGGLAAGIAILAWFVNAFAPLYDWLEWPSKLSPFSWYLHDMPLLNGFSSGHVWLLIAGIAFLLAALELFARRNIATEQAVVPEAAARRRKTKEVSPRSAWLLRSVMGKSLWDRRRSVWIWGFGLSTMTLLTFAAWPSLAADSEALQSLVESFPKEVLALFGLTDTAALATPEGFVSSRTYGSVGPIVVIVFAITAMASLIASEESTGRLDQVLSTAQERPNVIGEKSNAVFLLMGVIVLILLGVALWGNVQWDTGMDPVYLVTANIGLALLGLCFWGIAVGLWSVIGASGSVGATAAVAVATYFLNGLGASVDLLGPFRILSPWYWYLGDTVPLAKGLTWGYAALAAVAVGGTLYAMARFRTRDLAV